MERSRSNLSDGALIAQAHTHYRQGLVSTAELLADLAEIDARRIHVAMGYPSMRAWCIGELKMSDDAIQDRIQAARTAREYPTIFAMLADGRLHLTAVLMLSRYLTTGNAGELLAGAAGKTKSQLAEWLAARFPTSECLEMVTTIGTENECADSSVPERMPSGAFVKHGANASVPERMNGHVAHGTVTPVAAGRHRFEFMGSDAQRDLVRQVQDLRGPNASNDLATVFFDALERMKTELERRKCAKTDRPRRVPGRRRSSGRLVPAAVRREVWERDGHQCAFVGENGRRCEARRGLECDHITPVARGGESTVSNVRLLCRAHNQFEADRVFGRAFMEGKRTREAETAAPSEAVEHEQFLDVIAALQSLGVRNERARWAAGMSRMPGSTLEQHVRAALKLLKPRRVTMTPSACAGSAAVA